MNSKSNTKWFDAIYAIAVIAVVLFSISLIGSIFSGGSASASGGSSNNSSQGPSDNTGTNNGTGDNTGSGDNTGTDNDNSSGDNSQSGSNGSTNDEEEEGWRLLKGVYQLNETIAFPTDQRSSGDVYVGRGDNLVVGYITVYGKEEVIQHWTLCDGSAAMIGTVYQNGKWEEEAYRTLNFGIEGQLVHEDFYNWFIVNATLVEGSDSGTNPGDDYQNNYTLSGVWQFNETLTESGWAEVNSSYEHIDTGDTVVNGSQPFDAINFISNGKKYLGFDVTISNSSMADSRSVALGYMYWYTDTSVMGFPTYRFATSGTYYTDLKWTESNQPYRIVDFGATPQRVRDSFYTWFTINATYVGESDYDTIIDEGYVEEEKNYTVSVNLPTGVTAYPSNPTTISSSETVALMFDWSNSNGKPTIIANNCEYTCSYTGDTSGTLTITLSNPTGNVVVTAGYGEEITFTIEWYSSKGTEYVKTTSHTAFEGMTWSEWCDSGYNDIEYFYYDSTNDELLISETVLYNSNSYGTDKVKGGDVIIDGITYYMISATR